MLRKTMAKAGIKEIRTANGGVLKADNARSKESVKAQATFTGSKVVVTTTTGRTYETSKKDINKQIFKQNMHRLIDKF